MKKTYDTIVVGAGSMGMAAGYFLAKQGVDTLLIDANDPPHDMGSHHGETRTIRFAYGEGKQYIPLAIRAKELWNELEKESKENLFFETGVLCIGHPESSFVKEAIVGARSFSLPLTPLDGVDIRKKWPGISVPNDFIGCIEETSGVLLSEQCIRAYRRLALNNGAELLSFTPVTNIEFFHDGVKVCTKTNDYEADKLIVTTGAWTGKLLKELRLPVQPVRKTIAWFETENPLYRYPQFPAFSFDLKNELYYGTPDLYGQGIKIGRHDSGELVDPDTINRNFGAYHSDEEDIRNFLGHYMPQAGKKLKKGKVCIYTKTPDEHFIIDQHPKCKHVLIATGFSGHGFKFSSVIGEILSEWSQTGQLKYNMSAFSLSRQSLHRNNNDHQV